MSLIFNEVVLHLFLILPYIHNIFRIAFFSLQNYQVTLLRSIPYLLYSLIINWKNNDYIGVFSCSKPILAITCLPFTKTSAIVSYRDSCLTENWNWSKHLFFTDKVPRAELRYPVFRHPPGPLAGRVRWQSRHHWGAEAVLDQAHRG